MFKKVTRSIATQMGSKDDLHLVPDMSRQERFQPLCLVRRKEKTMLHPAPCYRATEYRLNHVLLPGAEEQKSTGSLLGVQESEQFTIRERVTASTDGKLDIPITPTSAEAGGAASLSRGWEIKLRRKHISVPELQALAEERKINVNHSFIKQLQITRQNLYVVHEVIETSEEATCEEVTKAEGSFIFKLYAKFCVKGTRESKESITIPKGCILAFRAIQLKITSGAWDLDYFPGARLSSFVSDRHKRISIHSLVLGCAEGELQALQAEVKQNCQTLSQLPPDLSAAFLEAIKAVMIDRNLFQELAQEMDGVLDGNGICKLQTESPDLQGLLSSLQCSEEDHLFMLAEAITYTLDALDELTEDQLLLLLESLEEKIVPQQLRLVASILEQDLELTETPFRVDARLLRFSREEEQELTMAMIERSGVKLQEDGSTVYEEEAFSNIAALYVSLYVLNLLSNSD